MGDHRMHMAVMAWMSDLAGMKRHGTIIRASCQAKGCGHWWDWPIDDLIAELGSDKATLWDRHPPCEICGEAVLFLACLPNTPCRPMISRNIPLEGLPVESAMDGWFGLRQV